MIWKDRLEAAVKLDAATDEKAIRNKISDANEILDGAARKIAFAIHDIGFTIARNVFSTYWTNMSSSVMINDEASGYMTRINIDREMTVPYTYVVYVLVTINGIKINKRQIVQAREGLTIGDDGLDLEYGPITALTLEGAKEMTEPQNIKKVVDIVMEDMVNSYELFLDSLGKKKHPQF